MRILCVGCLHAEWDLLVDKVEAILASGETLDLVLVAGDAETFRTEEDLKSFHAPEKYRVMGSFHKLYRGERRMPVPTIVIGGNHEANDMLHVMPFGGWIAENIFYAGRASCLVVGNVSIALESGIHGKDDYFRRVDESYPIREERDQVSATHLRAFSDLQLLGLNKADIVVTHDWPSGMAVQAESFLRKCAPHLIQSDRAGTFGLPAGMRIMERLQPSYWFAAHHHRYVKWQVGETWFIAVPKTIHKKGFFILEMDGQMGPIKYRGDWLSILKVTSEIMANPAVLKGKNWDEVWRELVPKMEQLDDDEVLPFTPDLMASTAAFCLKYGIFCPNSEVREYMKQKGFSNPTQQHEGEGVLGAGQGVEGEREEGRRRREEVEGHKREPEEVICEMIDGQATQVLETPKAEPEPLPDDRNFAAMVSDSLDKIMDMLGMINRRLEALEATVARGMQMGPAADK